MKQISVTYCICVGIFSVCGSEAFVLSKHRHQHKPTTISTRHSSISSNKRQRITNHQITTTNIHMLPIDESDQILALWIVSFASSHIGMSAKRTNIISSIGDIMQQLKLVGNDDWKLPDYWPGDNTGGQQIFPDSLTAGRQVYRAWYTAVSFITLGSAFAAYLQSSANYGNVIIDMTTQSYMICLYIAALSFGAAIASLFNASPLGLMPSFEAEGNDNTTRESGNASIAGITRDDTLKFTTRGLTRITRHPLILPIVPWGFATAYLASGRTCDWILFGGLSIYAIAGCYAQDLRVIKEEGSVGTVFGTEQGRNNNSDKDDEGNQLKLFFEQTSFIPFKAVFDGRQSLYDIGREAPWLQFVVGTILGFFAEEKILQLLGEWSI